MWNSGCGVHLEPHGVQGMVHGEIQSYKQRRVDILYLIDDFCHSSMESQIQFRSFLKNQHRYQLLTRVRN